MANLGTDWTKVTSMEDSTSWSKELSSAISTTWSKVLVFFSKWENSGDELWENVTSMYEEL